MSNLADNSGSTNYRVLHEPANNRFVLMSANGIAGTAYYRLYGKHTIDFHHTVVDRALRGTGLGNLLAHSAVTHEITRGRKITASCWFIEKFLHKHSKQLRNNHKST